MEQKKHWEGQRFYYIKPSHPQATYSIVTQNYSSHNVNDRAIKAWGYDVICKFTITKLKQK